MQRRAAALYFVFFLVIAVGAWAYTGVAADAHEPEFGFSGTTIEGGDSATIDGVEYSVGEITVDEGDRESDLTWTNASAQQTATLSNESTVAYDGGEYVVAIPNASGDPSSFTLHEQLNVSALLAADDAVENDVATQNDTDYVVFAENRTLVPLAEWLPENETVAFDEGDEMAYENETTTVDAVEPSGVTLVWEGSTEEDTGLSEGGNVTLVGGGEYFAHFPSDDEVMLAPQSEYPEYSQTVSEREYLDERVAGLWGVAIISGFAALIVLSVAYLPTRG